MNGRVARHLRRQAEALTVGQPRSATKSLYRQLKKAARRARPLHR